MDDHAAETEVLSPSQYVLSEFRKVAETSTKRLLATYSEEEVLLLLQAYRTGTENIRQKVIMLLMWGVERKINAICEERKKTFLRPISHGSFAGTFPDSPFLRGVPIVGAEYSDYDESYFTRMSAFESSVFFAFSSSFDRFDPSKASLLHWAFTKLEFERARLVMLDTSDNRHIRPEEAKIRSNVLEAYNTLKEEGNNPDPGAYDVFRWIAWHKDFAQSTLTRTYTIDRIANVLAAEKQVTVSMDNEEVPEVSCRDDGFDQVDNEIEDDVFYHDLMCHTPDYLHNAMVILYRTSTDIYRDDNQNDSELVKICAQQYVSVQESINRPVSEQDAVADVSSCLLRLRSRFLAMSEKLAPATAPTVHDVITERTMERDVQSMQRLSALGPLFESEPEFA